MFLRWRGSLTQYEADTETAVERLYLGGDAYSAPAVYVKEAGLWKMYYICRDYLGSITHIANADGTLKAEYSYDAWGRLRNPVTQAAYAPGSEPVLFLGRGYTGHEHLPWFGLINMNARLYDPALGRFLSPDPYIQMPDFTQNYNRYSYGLNNPLCYIDQSGELFWLIPVAIGAIIGGYVGGVATNKGQLNPLSWNWKAPETYLGIAFGGIFGAVAGYGIAVPGSINFGIGLFAEGPWGGITVGVGGIAAGGSSSDWNFHWTTSAGGGGNISKKHEYNTPKINRLSNSNFFNGSATAASNMLVHMSILNNAEGVMYKTSEGYFYENYSGYVFGDYSKYSNFTYSGVREDGTLVYFGRNTLDRGVFYQVTNDRIEYGPFSKNKYYLDLGMGRRYEVLEYYHTHPNNSYISGSDMDIKYLNGYAIGWDGVWRSYPPSYMLNDIIIKPKK